MSTSDDKIRGNKYLSRYELSIVRAFAGACKSIITDYSLDICDFLGKILLSDIFNQFNSEHTVYTQSSRCIASILLDEIKEYSIKDVSDERLKIGDAPVAYWMGYVLMYWRLLNPDDDLTNISIESLYWSYDSLHTADILYAIDVLKEEQQ